MGKILFRVVLMHQMKESSVHQSVVIVLPYCNYWTNIYQIWYWGVLHWVVAGIISFNGSWIFPTYFPEILKNHITRKSFQWEPSCSVRTKGHTDMTQLIVSFCNFSNVPKMNVVTKYVCCIAVHFATLTFKLFTINFKISLSSFPVLHFFLFLLFVSHCT